jgi:hypothetical protein
MSRERRRSRPPRPRRNTIDYTDCDNPIDPITQFPFNADDDILFIYYNGKWTCFDREGVLELFQQESSRMAYWIGGDASGYGGRPDLNRRVYKLPDGITWIDRPSKRMIEKSDSRYFARQVIEQNVPIGNVYGLMGVSMLHGNNPQTISKLIRLIRPEHPSEEEEEDDDDSDLSDIPPLYGEEQKQEEKQEENQEDNLDFIRESERLIQMYPFTSWLEVQGSPNINSIILCNGYVNSWLTEIVETWDSIDEDLRDWILERIEEELPLGDVGNINQFRNTFARAIEEGEILAMLHLRTLAQYLTPNEEEYEHERWFLLDAILSSQWDVALFLMRVFSFHEPVIESVRVIIFQLAITDEDENSISDMYMPVIVLTEQLHYIYSEITEYSNHAYIREIQDIYNFTFQENRIPNAPLRQLVEDAFRDFFTSVQLFFNSN